MFHRLALLLCALPLAACSSSSSSPSDQADSGAIVPTPPSPAFADYCVATTLTVQHYVAADGFEAGDAVPIGTPFLLTESGSYFLGEVTMSDGSFRTLHQDYAHPMVSPVDFSTDCHVPAGDDASETPKELVALEPATFYADVAMTQQACAVPQAAVLIAAGDQNYSFDRSGSSTRLQSKELQSRCGFDTGYSGDSVDAFLIRR